MCLELGFLFHFLQNVSVLMELVMRESMEMDHVCVIMAGKEHFVMNVSCSLTCYRQLGSSEYWQVYGKLLFWITNILTFTSLVCPQELFKI